jgi:hypothetical protein
MCVYPDYACIHMVSLWLLPVKLLSRLVNIHVFQIDLIYDAQGNRPLTSLELITMNTRTA